MIDGFRHGWVEDDDCNYEKKIVQKFRDKALDLTRKDRAGNWEWGLCAQKGEKLWELVEMLMIIASRKREVVLYQENQSKNHSQRRGATAQLSSVRANAVRKQKKTRRKGHCVLGWECLGELVSPRFQWSGGGRNLVEVCIEVDVDGEVDFVGR